jgi:hypothetical protein
VRISPKIYVMGKSTMATVGEKAPNWIIFEPIVLERISTTAKIIPKYTKYLL